MTVFKKYQKVSRYKEKPECRGIDKVGSTIYIFSKLDGSNGSVWADSNGFIRCGGRNQALSESEDNRNFAKTVLHHTGIQNFLADHPNYRLFGEWLIKHTIAYEGDAYNKFYVFDVVEYSTVNEGDESKVEKKYLSYDEYKPLLTKYGIDFIPAIATVEVVEENEVKVLDGFKIGEQCKFDKYLVELLDANTFLTANSQPGEGVVLKNYSYTNSFGAVIWAKCIHKNFNNSSAMPSAIYGKNIINEVLQNRGKKGKKIQLPNETRVIESFLKGDLLQKEVTKFAMTLDDVAPSEYASFLPRNKQEGYALINAIFYEFIAEEAKDFVKKLKRPVIDFKILHLELIKKFVSIYPSTKELFN